LYLNEGRDKDAGMARKTHKRRIFLDVIGPCKH
jgi:hypothetical protein